MMNLSPQCGDSTESLAAHCLFSPASSYLVCLDIAGESEFRNWLSPA
jgi:hypothetical protein